jgi:hypothetical protein
MADDDEDDMADDKLLELHCILFSRAKFFGIANKSTFFVQPRSELKFPKNFLLLKFCVDSEKNSFTFSHVFCI